MPDSLVEDIKLNIIYRLSKEKKSDLNEFIQELPINLHSQVQLEIHKDLFSNGFFLGKRIPIAFYGWMGANLRHEKVIAGVDVYQEGDVIQQIFILHKGLVGYFLERYQSYFAIVEYGNMFGHIDFSHSCKKKDKKPKNVREFTIRALEQSEFVSLSTSNLMNLKAEFPEIYKEMFKKRIWKLWIMKKIKEHAIKLCQQKQDEDQKIRSAKTSSFMLDKVRSRLEVNFNAS